MLYSQFLKEQQNTIKHQAQIVQEQLMEEHAHYQSIVSEKNNDYAEIIKENNGSLV